MPDSTVKYANDVWMEDACTNCTCKASPSGEGKITCLEKKCEPLICEAGFESRLLWDLLFTHEVWLLTSQENMATRDHVADVAVIGKRTLDMPYEYIIYVYH